MTVHNVSSAGQLTTALGVAVAGDTISLAAGNYGTYTISNKDYASDLIITSADTGNQAVFARLFIDGCTHILLDYITGTYVWQSGDGEAGGRFQIDGSCTYITLRNCTVNGDDADDIGAQWQRGIQIDSGASHITLEDCYITGTQRGVLANAASHVTMTRVEITDSREGINIPQCTNVLIDNCYVHDFRLNYALGDHADMFQLFSAAGGVVASDITIQNSIFDMGEHGAVTQIVFARNEEVDIYGGGSDKFYQNITVSGNYIRGAMVYGIYFGESNNISITDNVLVWLLPDMTNAYNADAIADEYAEAQIPKIAVASASTNVTVTGNRCYGAPHGSVTRFSYPAGATASDNLTFKDNTGPAVPSWPGGDIEPPPDPLPAVQTATLTISVTV